MTAQALLQRGALQLDRRAPCLAVLAALIPTLVACRPQRPTVRDADTTSVTRQAAQCTAVVLHGRGLELVVLGSGGPRSAGRAASSYLFAVDGVPRMVVDVGPGSFARLGETGLSAERLDTVLLTHLHIDHAGDLAGLVKSRDLSSDDAVAFRIVGPTGRVPYPSTSEFVERLFGENGAYAYLPSFRNELRLDRTDVAVDLEAPPRHVLDVDGVTISAVTADHGEVPAVAYRLESAGGSFVISGDLASRRGQFRQLVRGADVLVYDTAVLDPPGSPENLYELHTPPRRIGEIAAEAGVKVLVLGHIPPAVDAQRDEVLKSIRHSFKGDVRFAEDCMHLPIGEDR